MHFANGPTQVQPPLEVFKLQTTTHMRDLEIGKGDTASITSDPR